jgi:transcriptional regulator with XRE-family HTH domain
MIVRKRKSKSKTVASIILRRRAELKLTQKELARRSGLTVSKLVAYEHGGTVPGAEGIARLAKVIDCAEEMRRAYDRQWPGWRAVVRDHLKATAR